MIKITITIWREDGEPLYIIEKKVKEIIAKLIIKTLKNERND